MKDQYHQSSLLNEKGNIPIYRVSDETRKKGKLQLMPMITVDYFKWKFRN